MAQHTSEITVYDLEHLEDKVKAFNKKAARAGVSPTSWRLLSEETKVIKYNRHGQLLLTPYEVFSHYVVEITHERVVLPGGWQLAGVIDHSEGLTRGVPGTDLELILSHYVERGPVCDHCHTSRDRSETFILYTLEGEEVKQVGRQCLGLFLGMDAEQALRQVQLASETLEFDEEWTGAPKSKGYDLGHFLTHAACMIRTAGWRSRTTAKENGQPATADMTIDNMSNQFYKRKGQRFGEPLWIDPNEADGYLANQVVVWLEGLSKRNGLSDYMVNLAQIGKNGFCTDKSAGYAASAINAYLKEKEEFVKQAEKVKSSGVGAEWVGEIGGRITLNASKVSSAGFDTQFGHTFIHKFIAEGGLVLVWRTQNELDNGRYSLTGTVKKHGEFRGERQTELTRCKIGLPK